ncbi:DUF448 domain-containing protein [Sphingomonas montanisoli]|uniref:DUF448 domain-containing protein n=1 Tax=Sphingomonas montanisoli TaxID=2606412 RepID=A0A5D9C6X9_9SPHN|nr:DUF448 domain-containing protein [Sphingomonas montanisoli]TZG27439.1 DUF448 domain-containing protein [Sphingomonas montanisoli]
MSNDEHFEGIAEADTGTGGKHVPERKCILTGAHDARANLIRLALGPDGIVLPDLRAKAPGRGAWIGVDKAALEIAIAKGKLKGALSRAFKTGEITIPADLPDMIAQGLQRLALDRLGLENRAGAVLAGSDRIEEAARRGQVHLLYHAADAGTDGNRKLDQALRVGSDREGSDLRGLVIPVSRTILSMALGRENVVHIALTAPASAARVAQAFARWCGFIGRFDAPVPCEDASRGPSAL